MVTVTKKELIHKLCEYKVKNPNTFDYELKEYLVSKRLLSTFSSLSDYVGTRKLLVTYKNNLDIIIVQLQLAFKTLRVI